VLAAPHGGAEADDADLHSLAVRKLGEKRPPRVAVAHVLARAALARADHVVGKHAPGILFENPLDVLARLAPDADRLRHDVDDRAPVVHDRGVAGVAVEHIEVHLLEHDGKVAGLHAAPARRSHRFAGGAELDLVCPRGEGNGADFDRRRRGELEKRDVVVDPALVVIRMADHPAHVHPLAVLEVVGAGVDVDLGGLDDARLVIGSLAGDAVRGAHHPARRHQRAAAELAVGERFLVAAGASVDQCHDERIGAFWGVLAEEHAGFAVRLRLRETGFGGIERQRDRLRLRSRGSERGEPEHNAASK